MPARVNFGTLCNAKLPAPGCTPPPWGYDLRRCVQNDDALCSQQHQVFQVAKVYLLESPSSDLLILATVEDRFCLLHKQDAFCM